MFLNQTYMLYMFLYQVRYLSFIKFIRIFVLYICFDIHIYHYIYVLNQVIYVFKSNILVIYVFKSNIYIIYVFKSS